MKHSIETFLGIVAILFLGWYLPVSYMNVFSCDDFWFGTNVRYYGFWGNQLFYWENWEGSYIHTFLASLPHTFDGLKVPFLSNILSFLCLFCSLLLFFKTFTKIGKRRGILAALYVLSFIYLFTNGISEIRFWVCANITYLIECSIIISVISYYHKFKNEPLLNNLLILIVLLFLLAGCKINFIAYGIGTLILHDLIFKNTPNRSTLLICAIFCIFLCINIFAPGNYVRLVEETGHIDISERMSIFEVLMFRFEKIASYPIYSLLLFPLIPYLKLEISINCRKLIGGGLFVIAMFVIDGLLMFLCFNDPGPNRVYICVELSIIAYMVVVLHYICNNWIKKEIIVRFLSFVCVVFFAFRHMLIYPEVSPSIEYSKRSLERDSYVLQADSSDIIRVKALPESYLLLSYFSNEEPWLENVYLPYFNKKGKVIITNKDE